MTHKRKRRAVPVICTNCGGSGSLATKDGFRKRCPECKGTGSVEKWITEIVNEDETENT